MLRTLLALSPLIFLTPLHAEPFVHTIRIEPTRINLQSSVGENGIALTVRGEYGSPIIDPDHFTLTAVSAKMQWGIGSHVWIPEPNGKTIDANSSVTLGFRNTVLLYDWATPDDVTTHTFSKPLEWKTVPLPSLPNFRRSASNLAQAYPLNFSITTEIGGLPEFGPPPNTPSKFAHIKLGQLEISYTLERTPNGWDTPPVWWDRNDTPRIFSRYHASPHFTAPFPAHLYTTFDLVPGLMDRPRITPLQGNRFQIDFLGRLQTNDDFTGLWQDIDPEPMSPHIVTVGPFLRRLFFRSFFY